MKARRALDSSSFSDSGGRHWHGLSLEYCAGCISELHCRNRQYAENKDCDTASTEAYTRDMTRYLQKHDVHFLDYIHSADINIDCYANGDHLNEQGKQVWTRLMAEDLTALLAGTRARRERTK